MNRSLREWGVGLAFVCFLGLVLEITIRSFYAYTTEATFLAPKNLIIDYYPELRSFIDHPDQESEKVEVLILGGSVVHRDFCDLDPLLNPPRPSSSRTQRFKVYNLGAYTQTSQDSRIKYELLRGHRFDYVIVYHGINDTRANNSPKALFRADYRHIGFYDEVHVLLRHPEINLSMIPYVLDIAWLKLGERFGWRPRIPAQYFVNDGEIQSFDGAREVDLEQGREINKLWWDAGNEIKSAAVFLQNFERIIELAEQRGERVVLLTYAWHIPADYSLEEFFARSLSYSRHSYPAEIWGDPENVRKGLKQHNGIVRKLCSENADLLCLDIASLIPKTAMYFDDPCHLTTLGCELMGRKISEALGAPN